jgi:dihydrofolate synthase / folylpolyglutamate synthase
MSRAPLDYAAAVEELRRRGRYGVSLGLERITDILEELGHPERALRGALVGGTNGKGSVVALAGAVLRAAGLRVGTMPKPHLVSYRERIAIDAEPISAPRFAAAVARVLPAVDRIGERIGPPTEFEALTAAAFTELAEAQIDIALVEVGLGGRLDATNVLDAGVAVITNVQHDHERQLGSTLVRIGTEKAAIIKAGNLAVTGAIGRGLRPILDQCSALGVPMRLAGAGRPYRAVLRHAGWDGIVVDAWTPERELAELRIGLLGGHQAGNTAIALALLEALAEDADHHGRHIGLSEEVLRRGLAGARWPGRLELLRDGRYGRVLLDGAHNPAGARALAVALTELGLRGFPLVFGAMRTKRVTALLRALAPLEPRPVFTRVTDPGAREPASLLRSWRRIGEGGEAADDPAAALECAASLRAGDEPIVVAGSLYLVGAVRGMLTGEGEETG